MPKIKLGDRWSVNIPNSSFQMDKSIGTKIRPMVEERLKIMRILWMQMKCLRHITKHNFYVRGPKEINENQNLRLEQIQNTLKSRTIHNIDEDDT